MKTDKKDAGATLTLAALEKTRELLNRDVEQYPRKHEGPHLIDKQVNACIICGEYLGEKEVTPSNNPSTINREAEE